MTSEADHPDPGAAGGAHSGAPQSDEATTPPEGSAVPHPDVPDLELDETVAPRPEEEIADAVRGTDSTPAGPGSV